MHFEENLIFLIRRAMHFLENHKQMINNAKAYLTYGLWNLSMIKNMLNGFISLLYSIISIHDRHKYQTSWIKNIYSQFIADRNIFASRNKYKMFAKFIYLK